MDHEKDVHDISGTRVAAAVDFHEVTVYRLDEALAGRPEQITPDDPHGLARNVYHRHGNPDGVYEADSDEFWRDVGHGLSPASEILLLSNGRGKANASHHLVAWLEKHMSDVAAKIVGDVRVDLSALTDEQVLRTAQSLLGHEQVRDHGDSRRGLA